MVAMDVFEDDDGVIDHDPTANTRREHGELFSVKFITRSRVKVAIIDAGIATQGSTFHANHQEEEDGNRNKHGAQTTK